MQRIYFNGGCEPSFSDRDIIKGIHYISSFKKLCTVKCANDRVLEKSDRERNEDSDEYDVS